MIAKRRDRHQVRDVSGRGFALHLRCFGVALTKMYSWIDDHRDAVTNLLTRELHGEEFDARMSVAGIARGDYRPDRALDLTGAAAYIREKRVFMKYLGLARADGIVTQRMIRYVQQVEGGTNPNELLRQYGVEVKLACPQVRTYRYRSGQKQASYAHYRIRPYVMLLYALRQAKDAGVILNTDDIVLSVLRFYPPQKIDPITEASPKAQIDAHIQSRSGGAIDYEAHFRALHQEVEAELATEFSDPITFKQKCRNAANEAWCFLIFAEKVGLVDTVARQPSHWSATQQEYEKAGRRTPPTKYQEVYLTPIGERLLAEADTRNPVWFADLQSLAESQHEALELASIIARLAAHEPVPDAELPQAMCSRLTVLSIHPIPSKEGWLAERTPLFHFEYDLP